MHFLVFLWDQIEDPPTNTKAWLKSSLFYEILDPLTSFHTEYLEVSVDNIGEIRHFWFSPGVLAFMVIFLLLQAFILWVFAFKKGRAIIQKQTWIYGTVLLGLFYLLFYWVLNQFFIFHVNRLLVSTVFSNLPTLSRVLLALAHVSVLIGCLLISQSAYILSSEHLPTAKNIMSYVHFWSPIFLNVFITGAHLVKEILKNFHLDYFHAPYSFCFYFILVILLGQYHIFFDFPLSLLSDFWISLLFSVNIAMGFSNAKGVFFSKASWYSHPEPLLLVLISLSFYFCASIKRKKAFFLKLSFFFNMKKVSPTQALLFISKCTKSLDSPPGNWENSLFWVSVYQYHKTTCKIHQKVLRLVNEELLLKEKEPKEFNNSRRESVMKSTKAFQSAPLMKDFKTNVKESKSGSCHCTKDLKRLKNKPTIFSSYSSSPEKTRLLRFVRSFFEDVIRHFAQTKKKFCLPYFYICYSSFLYVYFSNPVVASIYLNIADRFLRKIPFKECLMMKNLRRLINKNQAEEFSTEQQQKTAKDLESCIKIEEEFAREFLPKFSRALDLNMDFWDFIQKNTVRKKKKSFEEINSHTSDLMKGILTKNSNQNKCVQKCFKELFEINPRYSVLLKTYSLFKLFVVNEELSVAKMNKLVQRIINEQQNKKLLRSSSKLDVFLSEKSGILRVSGFYEDFGKIIWASDHAQKLFNMASKQALLNSNFVYFLPNSVSKYHAKFISNYYAGSATNPNVLGHIRKMFIVTLKNELIPIYLYVSPFLSVHGRVQFSALFNEISMPSKHDHHMIMTSSSGVIDGVSKTLLKKLHIDSDIVNFENLSITSILPCLHPFFSALRSQKASATMLTINKAEPKNIWQKEFFDVKLKIGREVLKSTDKNNNTDSIEIKLERKKEETQVNSFMEISKNASFLDLVEENSSPKPVTPLFKINSYSVIEVASPGVHEHHPPLLEPPESKAASVAWRMMSKNKYFVNALCNVRLKKFSTTVSSSFSVLIEITHVKVKNVALEDGSNGASIEENIQIESNETEVLQRKMISSRIRSVGSRKQTKFFKKELQKSFNEEDWKKGCASRYGWKLFIVLLALGMMGSSILFSAFSYQESVFKFNESEYNSFSVNYNFMFFQKYMAASIPFFETSSFLCNESTSSMCSLAFLSSELMVEYMDSTNDIFYSGFMTTGKGLSNTGSSQESIDRLSLAYDLTFNFKTLLNEPAQETQEENQSLQKTFLLSLPNSAGSNNFQEFFIEKVKEELWVFWVILFLSIALVLFYSALSVGIMAFLESQTNNLIQLFFMNHQRAILSHFSGRRGIKEKINLTLEDFNIEKLNEVFDCVEAYTRDSKEKKEKCIEELKNEAMEERISSRRISHKVSLIQTSRNKRKNKSENLKVLDYSQTDQDAISAKRIISSSGLMPRNESRFQNASKYFRFFRKTISMCYMTALCLVLLIYLSLRNLSIQKDIVEALDFFENNQEDLVYSFSELQQNLENIQTILCPFLLENSYGVSECTEASYSGKIELDFQLDSQFETYSLILKIFEELAQEQNTESLMESDFCRVFSWTAYLQTETATSLGEVCREILTKVEGEEEGYLIAYQLLAAYFEEVLIDAFTEFFDVSIETQDSGFLFKIDVTNPKKTLFLSEGLADGIQCYVFMTGISNFILMDYFSKGEWNAIKSNMTTGGYWLIAYYVCFELEMLIVSFIMMKRAQKRLSEAKRYRRMLRLFPDDLIKENTEALLYLGGKKLVKAAQEAS